MKAVIKKLKINRLIFYISILNKKNYKLNDSIKAYNELNKVCFNNNCSCYCERLISNKTYDLGIVIPAYNVQKYISKCLDSITNQKTSYKIQIIVIDDGSTALYDELKEIHKKSFPDMRFGQLMMNFLGFVNSTKKRDPFFPESEEMLELFKEYANSNSMWYQGWDLLNK